MSKPVITPRVLDAVAGLETFSAEVHIDSIRQITRWVINHHAEIDEDDGLILEVVGNLLDLGCTLEAFVDVPDA